MTDAGGTGRVTGPVGACFGDDWWRRGVIYQIYPRSFADGDGDGLGDLRGVIDHLDHLGPDGLGVDAIWLSPIYPSPGVDGGYDVTDHSRVDPKLGGDETFDTLVARGASARHPGDPRPRDEPHERPASVVRRLPPGPARADGRPLHLARPERGRRGRGAAPAEQLGLVVRRYGVDLRAGARPVLPPHVPRRAARGRLARAGRRGRDVRHGPWLARTWRGRLPPRHVQRLPQAPAPCPRTRRVGAPRPGLARSTATTSTSRTCRPSWTGSGPSSMPARADVGGRALRRRARQGRGADARPPPRLRLGAPRPAVARRTRSRRRSGAASAPSATGGRPSSSRTMTSRGTCPASPARSAHRPRTATRSPRPRRPSC